ncbi:transposase [Candidatus Pacearchaeota archaeon]|nr:transposase [Candidatus Pacearchaeota archaeon]
MRKSYKYRIYPTKSQIGKLENTFSMCRYLYNWNFDERMSVYKSSGENISYSQQQNALPALKSEKPWFGSVHSQVLQDVLKRLDKAYQNFFRKPKTNKAHELPKFKKRGQWNSITYPQFKKRPRENNIKVPKIGNVKIVHHRAIPDNAKIKTLTISKEAGKWFACFSFEFESQIEPKEDLSNAVGIDLGLYDFFYPTFGSPVSAPKFLRISEKRLKRLQTKLSHTKKRTVEYFKVLKALRKVHYKIKCQRNNFLHKEANKLLESSNLIVHEKLNIRKMLERPKPIKENNIFLSNGAKYKSMLHKSIGDAGWGIFLKILNYKANEQGKGVIAVNPYMTSQKCSQCGEIVKKSLSTRTHRCPHCGYTANRDLNAAYNILRLGLESLGLEPIETPTIASA